MADHEEPTLRIRVPDFLSAETKMKRKRSVSSESPPILLQPGISAPDVRALPTDTRSRPKSTKRISKISGKKLETFTYKPRAAELRYGDSVPPEILDSLDSTERKRQEVIFELINTEQLYFRDLRIITDAFVRPIANADVISQAEQQQVFGNIEEVVTAGEKFMRALELLQQQNPIVEEVAPTILENVDNLKPAFIEYCGRQSIVEDILHELEETNDAFREFLKERGAKPIFRGLKLGSFLIAPFQRLCKYPLLIKEIISYTPETHSDRLKLEMAYDKMKEILDLTNARAVSASETLKLREIRKKIDKKYVELLDSCTLELEAEVNLEKDGAITNLDFILLNRALLICKFRRDTIKVTRKVEILNLQALDLLDGKNDLTVAICGEIMKLTFSGAEVKQKWKERIQVLHTNALIEMMKIKAVRRKRAKRVLQPDIADPQSETELLSNENQYLANQLHEIALQFSPNESRGVPIENPVMRQKKKILVPKMKPLPLKSADLQAIDERPEPVPYRFKPLRESGSTQLVVLFHGTRLAGKTTFAKEAIRQCREQNLRCAYVHESEAPSILQPFRYEVDPEMKIQTLLNNSLMLGSFARSLLQIQSADQFFDVVFVDGEFPFESQISGIVKTFEQDPFHLVACFCYAPLSLLTSRYAKLYPDRPPQKEPRQRIISVPGAIMMDGSEPVDVCIRPLLNRIFSLFKINCNNY